LKYGIFSDIHSNLEAFQTVLEQLKEEGVDKYIYLGDIVGYGADPKECIQLLKSLVSEHECITIAGNHDYAVCGLTDTKFYGVHAIQSIEWTKTVLDKEEIKFLTDLRLVQQLDGLTCVHANLSAPEEWGYVFDIDDAYSTFLCLSDQICFIGHSHRPIVFTAGEMVDWDVKTQTKILRGEKYIINVGSVGQPRDGNAESAYCIYDTDTQIVDLKRVGYDIESAQKKIIAAGLPKVLADRLRVGK